MLVQQENYGKKMGTIVTELDIEEVSIDEFEKAIHETDILYFTGGNTFFLLEVIRKNGLENVIKKAIDNGKMYVGESAGAVICSPDINYIKYLDPVPENSSLKDYMGLHLVDKYILPHMDSFPFKAQTKKVMKECSELDLLAITNKQALLIQDGKYQMMDAK